MWLWVTFDSWSRTRRVIWRAQQGDLQLVCKTLRPSLTVIIHFSLQRDYLVRRPCIQSFRTTICFEAWRARPSLLDAPGRDLWVHCEWDKKENERMSGWVTLQLFFLINFEWKFHFSTWIKLYYAAWQTCSSASGKGELEAQWNCFIYSCILHIHTVSHSHTLSLSVFQFQSLLINYFMLFNDEIIRRLRKSVNASLSWKKSILYLSHTSFSVVLHMAWG